MNQLKMNVVGTVKRSELSDCPDGASHVLLTPNGRIQSFYRFLNEEYNDGSTRARLQYFSSFNVWTYSGYNNTDGGIPDELKFLAIED